MIDVRFGDCLKLMKQLPSGCIDMVLCDLPYGTTKCIWDSPIDLVKLWEQYKRIVKPGGAILLFAQTPFDKVLGASNLPMLRYEWIWEKTQATGHLNAKKMPLKSHENILVFYKRLPVYNPQKTNGHKPINSYTKYIKTQNNTQLYGEMKTEISGGGETDRFPRSVLLYSSDKQREYLHPTQKPLALCEYFILTYSNEGALILDNCAGSGTTGVACFNTKRECILMENDKKEFNTLKSRIDSLILA